MLLLSLLACIENSKVPVGALLYRIAVEGVGPDTCHPGSTEGWGESYDYAVFFDASSADVYVDGEPFASGTVSQCVLTYQTVTILEERSAGNLKWQLTGQARLDAGDDGCVEGENDFEGTETFEIVDSDDDNIEIGCTYPTSTAGTYTGEQE